MKLFLDLISLLITAFIGYHIYFLSQKLSFKETLNKREEFQKKLDNLINKKIYLVNIQRYRKDYPAGELKLFQGEVDRTSNLKNYFFDGIEVFEETVSVYKIENENYTFDKKRAIDKKEIKCYIVGFIPYEWIEYVSETGDEFEGRPQIFCYYKGWLSSKCLGIFKKYRSPLKKIKYFIKAEEETKGLSKNGNNMVNYTTIKII